MGKIKNQIKKVLGWTAVTVAGLIAVVGLILLKLILIAIPVALVVVVGYYTWRYISGQ